MNDPRPALAPQRSFLDRVLSLFTEVRGGEGITVVALACNVFLILTTYYLVKPRIRLAREPRAAHAPLGPCC